MCVCVCMCMCMCMCICMCMCMCMCMYNDCSILGPQMPSSSSSTSSLSSSVSMLATRFSHKSPVHHYLWLDRPTTGATDLGDDDLPPLALSGCAPPTGGQG